MRKLVICFVLVILLLGMACMGVATAKNTEKQEPELVKVVVYHYLQTGDSEAKVWDDTSEHYKFLYGGIKWTKTVTYELNTAGSGLDSTRAYETIRASLEVWDRETSFELFDDKVRITDQGHNSGDLINRITFDNLGSSGIIAVNTFWFNPATKVMSESDVQFNTYYSWSLSGETGKMDLQNIATHEFGHNGLNDLYSPPGTWLTMYGYSGPGEIHKRTLGAGDKLGIQDLYGVE